MDRRGAIVGFLEFALLPVSSLAQLPVSNADVQASEHSCRIIHLTLQARERHRTSEDGPPPDALQRGNLKEADRYLLAAVATPGSPRLDSFGPNMSLARELLEKGQNDEVLQFFELCRRFWESNFGKLDQVEC